VGLVGQFLSAAMGHQVTFGRLLRFRDLRRFGVKRTAQSVLRFEKFTRRCPNPQNAVDIFRDRWASDISEVVPGVHAGPTGHFIADHRPSLLLKNFATEDGTLTGMRILELGPLEGAHTYQLEKLGAEEVVAIEANAEAYLKCLVIKEVLELKRARFLHGDFTEYLRQNSTKWDLIFCCGVLYHMADPIALIELIAQRTDRMFVWTHYWGGDNQLSSSPLEIRRRGEQFTYYQHAYSRRDKGTFWGGNRESAFWMSRDDILRAVRTYGFVNMDMHYEDPTHENGACFSFSVWK
jgi:2-polyprenyl-3-methyl-5-hydroxy-6-metoxy-1,4-benzoquinol methylase